MTQRLDDLLRDCVANVLTPTQQGNGSGFFVAPGRLLTCAHVVVGAEPDATPITVMWRRQTYTARLLARGAPTASDPEGPDLALLALDVTDHPCVLLEDEVASMDALFTYGYSYVPERGKDALGDSVTLRYEGPTNDGQLLKLKDGQVQPGLSGAPLLNVRTGAVCGVVRRTRDERVDLGGRAVPVSTVLQTFPELQDLQRQFHARDGRWTEAWQSTNPTGAMAQASSPLDSAMLNEFLASEVRRIMRVHLGQDTMASVSSGHAPPQLDTPPLLARVSRREQTVKNVLDTLDSHVWTAVDGITGSGKTQLAILVTQAAPVASRWVRFPERATTAQACEQLDRVCAELVAAPLQGSRQQWYARMCERLGPGAIVVLDNLPRIRQGNGLAERLAQLVRGCREQGVRLLSTSADALPVTFREYFDDVALHPMHAPRLTEGEVREILEAHGAPPSLLKREIVVFVDVRTQAHPTLVNAMARYLKQRGWRFDQEALEGIFRGDYTAETNQETTQRLLDNIEDAESRDLLYRLSLVNGPFVSRDAYALATVAPPLARPQERLNQLVGLWVHRDSPERFLVSPLVTALGGVNVQAQTLRACHSVLARGIAQKGEIVQTAAMDAIGHFTQAEEFDQAGLLLVSALQGLHDVETTVSDGGLLLVWAQEPLPERMSIGIRLLVRALQIGVRERRGMPVDYLLNDIQSLLSQASPADDWVTLAIVIHVPMLASRYLTRALRFLQTAQTPEGDPIMAPNGDHLESLIWMHANEITTAEQRDEWMRILEQLGPEERRRAFMGTLAEAACPKLMQDPWLREARKPIGERNWPAVRDKLAGLVTRAAALGADLLWACAVRSQIIIAAGECEDLSAATAIAEAALARASDDPRVQFVLRQVMGQQYMEAKRYDDASSWFDAALAQETDVYPYFRMLTLLDASTAIYRTDIRAAIRYAGRAVAVAQSEAIIPESESVRALGQLAIVRWIGEGLPAAFDPLDQATQHLLACKDDTNDWKDLFVLFGHAAGYFGTLADTGAPPEEVLAGGPYQEPYPGMFTNHSTDTNRAGLYVSARDCLLPPILVMFAQGVGRDERAAYWIERGMGIAQTARQMMAVFKLSLESITELVVTDNYSEALYRALETARLKIALDLNEEAGGDNMLPGLEVEAVLGEKPNDRWREAEENALLLGLLPIIVRLSTIAVENVDRAREHATTVAVVCREIGAGATNPWIWTTAADLMEDVYVRRTSYAAVIGRVKRDDPRYHAVLHALSYLGATTQGDSLPEYAIAAHVAVVSGLEQRMRAITYRRIVNPFLIAYWTHAMAAMPFRFRSLVSAAGDLAHARTLPEPRQPRAILRAMRRRLDTVLRPEAEKWLRGNGQ